MFTELRKVFEPEVDHNRAAGSILWRKPSPGGRRRCRRRRADHVPATRARTQLRRLRCVVNRRTPRPRRHRGRSHRRDLSVEGDDDGTAWQPRGRRTAAGRPTRFGIECHLRGKSLPHWDAAEPYVEDLVDAMSGTQNQSGVASPHKRLRRNDSLHMQFQRCGDVAGGRELRTGTTSSAEKLILQTGSEPEAPTTAGAGG